MVHSYARSEGVCGVLISDEEYPARTAHGCLSKILDEFLTQNPISSFDSLPAGSKLPFAPLREYITKYQDPQNADSILKIQAELDATKIEMRKAIDSVLERGENLEQLVTKSNDLNSSSKAFYKQVGSSPPTIALLWIANCEAGKEAELVLRGHVRGLPKRSFISTTHAFE